MHDSKSFRAHLPVVGAVLASVVAAFGCSSEPQSEDPAILSAAMLGEASDSAHQGDLGRMAAVGVGADSAESRAQNSGMGMGTGSGMGMGMGTGLGLIDGVPQVAVRCDPEPEVEVEEICGGEIAAKTSYAWSACQMGRRGMGPDGNGQSSSTGGGGGGGGPLSTGSVAIEQGVSGDSEGCDASSPLSFEEVATIDINHVTPRGHSATMTGEVISSSEHALNATSYSKTVRVDLSREHKDDDGELLRTVTVTGKVEVAFAASDVGPRRTFDGQLAYDFGDEGSGSLQLDGVVRLDAAQCRFPVGGTVTRTDAEGGSHVIVYSEHCGQATLDGEAIDLTSVVRHGRGMGMGGQGKRGGGHRGSGQGDCPFE